jgi:hypothetical protein
MFKSFQNTSRSKGFNGFPALNFQMNNQAYGFSGCSFWLDAAYGLNTQTDLTSVSSWQTRISGMTYSQSTVSSQPRLIASNPLYNNYPTVESTATGQKLFNTSGFPLGRTVAFIANYNTISTVNAVFSRYQTLSSGTYGWVCVGGTQGGINGVAIRTQSLTTLSGTTETNSVKIVVITPNAIYVNGVLENSSANDLSNHNCGIIFGLSAGLNESLLGNLAEIISWNNDYTGSEIEISNRLNQKYAIY